MKKEVYFRGLSVWKREKGGLTCLYWKCTLCDRHSGSNRPVVDQRALHIEWAKHARTRRHIEQRDFRRRFDEVFDSFGAAR